MWTLFWDMHSGGGTKIKPYDKIYIEAPKQEAVTIFRNRFGRDSHHITCACCGEDYSLYEDETLEQASGFHRRCKFDTTTNKYIEAVDSKYYTDDQLLTIEEYIKKPYVLVIPANEITDNERVGSWDRYE